MVVSVREHRRSTGADSSVASEFYFHYFVVPLNINNIEYLPHQVATLKNPPLMEECRTKLAGTRVPEWKCLYTTKMTICPFTG